MKAKLLFLSLALTLTLTLRPSGAVSGPIISNPCLSFCSKVRCFPEDVCGQYVNSSGQTVCGCHPRDTSV
jgi:hypothetical protein